MRRAASFLLILSLCLSAGRPAAADSAPLVPMGPHLRPMENTSVRLESERIEIAVRRRVQEPHSLGWSAMADYRVQFRFVPAADEELTVGFPLFVIDGETHIWGAPIQDFRVTVDGRELPTETRVVKYQGAHTDWAVFPVTFRQGEPLEMTVTYSLPVEPLGKTWAADLWIAYVLRTGALWAGEIGKVEAVLKMDKPIRPEDVRTETRELFITTPDWTLKEGALHWEWQELEPDFDLSVRIANAYWLDTRPDIEALLQTERPSRETLLRVGRVVTALFQGDREGQWLPLRGGESSREAGEQLLPRVLPALQSHLAGHPQDWPVWEAYLEMLYQSAWHSWPATLLSEERLKLWLQEMHRYREAGGPPLPLFKVRPWRQPEMAAAGLSAATQEEIVTFLIDAMPAAFATESSALGWVENQGGDQLAPDYTEALEAEALRRMVPPRAESAPEAKAAAAVGSGANTAPAGDAGPEISAPPGVDAAPEAGTAPGSDPDPEAAAIPPVADGPPGWWKWAAGLALPLLAAAAVLYRRSGPTR